jgi:hypothetical protein
MLEADAAANHPLVSGGATSTNVPREPKKMKMCDAGGVCYRTRADDNASGKPIRFSLDARQYAYKAFYAFESQ